MVDVAVSLHAEISPQLCLMCLMYLVSVYTDPNCSDFATTVGLDSCVAAPILGSFSYDC